MPRAYFSQYEEKLNYKIVAGFDEAGRGCLAGPLSMAAVIYNPALKKARGLNDSKLVPPKRRQELFTWICQRTVWSHTFIDADFIDQHGLTAALYQGFEILINDLEQKTDGVLDYLLIDGKQKWQLLRPNESIISGDSRIRSIAAASIIAKVKRDRLMQLLDFEFPEYGFRQHVGYGTKKHIECLRKYGPSPLHRFSFTPVKELC